MINNGFFVKKTANSFRTFWWKNTTT